MQDDSHFGSDCHLPARRDFKEGCGDVMKKGWKVEKLGDVVQFQRGLTYSKGDEVDFSSNIVLRANNVDLNTNALDFTELKYIKDSIVIPKEKKVSKGSLIICTASGSKSHLGKVALIDDNYGYAFGGFMGQITPNPDINPRFLFYCMTSDEYKRFIEKLSDGVNINNLRFDNLAEFEIPLPSLPEQQRIVALLDETLSALDAVHAHAERNQVNAREVFEAALHTYFEEKKDEWEHVQLEKLTEEDSPITYGVVKPGDYGEIRFIRGGDISQGRVLVDQLRTITKEVSEQYKRTLLRGGELLMCLVGQPGQVAVAPDELAGSNLARQVGLIRLRKDINAEFVRFFLQSKNGQKALGAYTGGSVQQVINLGDLRMVEIPLPPLAEQRAIVKRLDALAKETKRLEAIYEQKSAAVDELKKSVLQKAFAGEL